MIVRIGHGRTGASAPTSTASPYRNPLGVRAGDPCLRRQVQHYTVVARAGEEA